ncbi:DUF4957 domain-containing protein [Sinomicrobium pectinilyticum]|uniref:DUF4957 domain-containing protein n=2 Tax=Sinomicrobium pectinilyticum TaxID=1084421 RepID=A0A3N0E5H7_SINP1|nr:DUF4957 domain-containing protein [Sinomicrobium pectinilyticum]
MDTRYNHFAIPKKEPMKPKYKKYRQWMLIVALALFLWNCSDDDNNAEGDGLSRMFTPGKIDAESRTTSVKLTWQPSLYTGGLDVTYTVQVSRDTLFADASGVEYEEVVDTAGITLTDENIAARRKYFARIKANALDNTAESYWMTSGSFAIQGVQNMLPVYDPERRATSVTLRWKEGTEFNRMEMTPVIGAEENGEAILGDPVEIPLNADDVASGFKVLENLEPRRSYQVEIYQNSSSMGYVAFTTRLQTVYAYTVSPGDDLKAVIDNAGDGEVIGLEPGVYELSGTKFNIDGKTVVLMSTSGNPENTILRTNQFTLMNDNAGLSFSGITFDLGGNLYFLDVASGAGATFKNVKVNNCIIENAATSAFRTDRADLYRIDTIQFSNTRFRNMEGSNYWMLHIEKTEVKLLELDNCTVNNIGRGIIRMTKSLDMAPKVVINHCTFNNFGGNGTNNTLFDGGSNIIDLTIQNSILANMPYEGSTVGTSVLRVNNDAAKVNISNNNFYNLTADGEQFATFPDYSYLTMQNNLEETLDWNASTEDFSLPQDSPLRTLSTEGRALGDVRWTY